MPNTHHSHHTHGHGSAEAGQKSNIGLAFALNLAFAVIEFVGGLLTNSVAILSDAVHDMGDSLSLALAWYFQRVSRRGRSARYTYGYTRFSLLGAIINSAILIAGSVYIVSQAVPRLFHPQRTDADGMFLLALLGIAINGIAVLRTRKSSSVNERVVSLHLLEDVLGWAAVLIGSAVMHFTGWTVIDPILSLAIACFVLVNAFKNVRMVMPILLQGTPADIDRQTLLGVLTSPEEVVQVHDLHVWSLDESYNIVTAHLVLSHPCSPERMSRLKERVRGDLLAHGIQHATLEFETSGEQCAISG